MIEGKRSKFEFGEFRDGYDDFAVNRDKYTLEEALQLYATEMDLEAGDLVYVTTEAFVRHHAGTTDDGEHIVGWWIEYEEHKTSCPVYAMHVEWHDRRIKGYDLHVIQEDKKNG